MTGESMRAGVTALFRTVERLRSHHAAVAERHGLTSLHAMVLALLDEPVSMRALAERLRCDASNATTLVDRLQRGGLVERLPDSGDRRVRVVRRTPAGTAAHERFDEDLFATAPFDAIPVDDLLAVRGLIDQTLGEHDQGWGTSDGPTDLLDRGARRRPRSTSTGLPGG